MLNDEHPIHRIVARLRAYQAPDPDLETIDQYEYRKILAELPDGLFEQLPAAITTAIDALPGELHGGLYEVFVELARDAFEGRPASSQLIASFLVRFQRYHAPDAAIDGSNVVLLEFQRPKPPA